MAKSEWYVKLNKIVSQCAVRDHFKLDMDQADAKKLAQDLLAEVKTKGRIKQFIRGGHVRTLSPVTLSTMILSPGMKENVILTGRELTRWQTR